MVEQLQLRDGRWTLVDIQGKHHKIRSVPVSATVYVALTSWLERAHITSGPIFRAVNRGDRMTSSAAMTPQGVRDVVKQYVCRLGLGAVAPHDLRRTFAKEAHRNGVPLEQIQLSLGHESIEVTAKYVGVDQDFQHAPSDAIVMHLDD
jgi:site-specific recombinase XerD